LGGYVKPSNPAWSTPELEHQHVKTIILGFHVNA